eukprot:810353-Alexandrium_andersonii.AAC.1
MTEGLLKAWKQEGALAGACLLSCRQSGVALRGAFRGALRRALRGALRSCLGPVSYTHLTLPTICSV